MKPTGAGPRPDPLNICKRTYWHDDVLPDASWFGARLLSHFYQRDPRHSTAVKLQTENRLGDTGQKRNTTNRSFSFREQTHIFLDEFERDADDGVSVGDIHRVHAAVEVSDVRPKLTNDTRCSGHTHWLSLSFQRGFFSPRHSGCTQALRRRPRPQP